MTADGGRPAARFQIRHLWLLLPMVGLAIRAVTPIRDNSFLWHVRAGEAQLDVGRVLTADPFSFTLGGEPWRTQSWLFELVYGWLFGLTGGVGWVPVMIFLVVGGCFVFLGLAIYRVVRDPLRTAIVLLLMTWVVFFFAVPRPVVVSFLLLAATVVVIQNAERVGWALVVILWLWAAVHGSWVVGGGLIVLEAVRRRSWKLAQLGVIGGIATLFTAHGLGTWEIFFSFLESREALDYLSEWATPDVTNPFVAPALLVVVGLGVGFWRRRLHLRDLVVIVPFAIFGAMALRSVFPALLVLVPYASTALQTDGKNKPVNAGNPVLNRAVAVALVAFAVIALARPVTIDPEELPPPEAVAALDSRPVFQAPAAGGLLIYAAWPERLVFIDDRAELFGAEGFEATVAALEARAWRPLFAEHDIGQVLLEIDWELVAALEAEGWQEQYADENWIVLSDPAS